MLMLTFCREYTSLTAVAKALVVCSSATLTAAVSVTCKLLPDEYQLQRDREVLQQRL